MRSVLVLLSASVALGLFLYGAVFVVQPPEAAAAAADAPAIKPVDDSMHHFMEYVFEPGYKRLKADLAKAPEGKAGWKAVKGDSLTIAEAANLLLIRLPEDNAADWKAHAVAVRSEGAALYQAARKSDFATARKHWETMITKCNACHKQFADGEHQLKP